MQVHLAAQAATNPHEPREIGLKRKPDDELRSTRTATRQPRSVDTICADCSTLDLVGALEKAAGIREFRIPSEEKELWCGIRIADVGQRYRQEPNTDCSLCSILFASRIGPAHPEGLVVNKDGDEIRLIGFLDYSGLVQDPWRYRLSESAHLAVVPRNFGSNRRRDFDLLKRQVQKQGAAVLLRDGDQPPTFAAKAVPDRFDASVASGWLRYCERNHTSQCGTWINYSITGLRLIDCTTRSIVDAERNCPFVALSYVWGSPGAIDTTVQREDNMLLLPEQLSPVVADAISVTVALGFQYLWVDKFCIAQDNPIEKHNQITQMNSIYESAELTIVAAAGTDETYGLPGVGQRPRVPQKTARLTGVQVVSTMEDPQSSIRSSRWASRGWTFQEAVLSRCRLVFTDQQAYFECNAMSCYESIYSRLDSLHLSDKRRFRDDIRGGIFGRDRRDNFGYRGPDEMSRFLLFQQYLSAIEDYSSRDLRFDADSLNAFQGIIQWYSKLNEPIQAIWGLPYPSKTKKIARNSNFCWALAWRHSHGCWEDATSRRPRRRQNFPSWTWAGWAGAVQVENASHRWSVATENCVLSVACGDRAKDRENLKALDCTSSGSKYRVLRLLAKALPPEHFSCRASRGQEEGKMGRWTFGEHKAEWFPSRAGLSEAQLAQELRDVEQWRCIWICCVDDVGFGMLLERNKGLDTWTRAGIFRIDSGEHGMETLMKNIDATWFAIE